MPIVKVRGEDNVAVLTNANGGTSVAFISETFEYIIKLNRFDWFK